MSKHIEAYRNIVLLIHLPCGAVFVVSRTWIVIGCKVHTASQAGKMFGKTWCKHLQDLLCLDLVPPTAQHVEAT